jgi:hypothetical protein
LAFAVRSGKGARDQAIGYRLIVRCDGGVRTFTRRGHDWTSLQQPKLRAKSFTLDGEGVVCGLRLEPVPRQPQAKGAAARTRDNAGRRGEIEKIGDPPQNSRRF